MPRPLERRVLTVANQKGGVGKTTSTVNIAAALAMHGIRVLVVDLDPQGNACTALDVEHRSGTPSVYDCCSARSPLAEAATQSSASQNLWCVPGHDRPGRRRDRARLDGRPRAPAQAGACPRAALDEVGVDYVLIDCPPSLGLLTVNALVAAEEVLIPIQCEYYALEGLGQLLTTSTSCESTSTATCTSRRSC